MRRKPKVYFDEDGKLILKPYRLKDLAVIFDMNVQTLKKWVDEYPEMQRKARRHYSIKQVEFLISKIGLPQKLVLQMDSTERITSKTAA